MQKGMPVVISNRLARSKATHMWQEYKKQPKVETPADASICSVSSTEMPRTTLIAMNELRANYARLSDCRESPQHYSLEPTQLSTEPS